MGFSGSTAYLAHAEPRSMPISPSLCQRPRGVRKQTVDASTISSLQTHHTEKTVGISDSVPADLRIEYVSLWRTWNTNIVRSPDGLRGSVVIFLAVSTRYADRTHSLVLSLLPGQRPRVAHQTTGTTASENQRI